MKDKRDDDAEGMTTAKRIAQAIEGAHLSRIQIRRLLEEEMDHERAAFLRQAGRALRIATRALEAADSIDSDEDLQGE